MYSRNNILRTTPQGFGSTKQNEPQEKTKVYYKVKTTLMWCMWLERLYGDSKAAYSNTIIVYIIHIENFPPLRR